MKNEQLFKSVSLSFRQWRCLTLICPFVETADMDIVVMTVTRLDSNITPRPWTDMTGIIFYDPSETVTIFYS